MDAKLGHLSSCCQQFSQSIFALLSAHQNVSQRLLTGIPAKDAPGFKPTVLHTVTDAYLQLSHHAAIIQQSH